MTELQHNHLHNFHIDYRHSPAHRSQEKSIENKKILHSLKQQISNIRKGMTRIMRAKSQENIKIMQKIKNQNKIIVTNKSIKIDLQDLTNQPKQLKKRIIYLQKENLRLSNELQQVKIIKNSQISALNHRKKQLQKEKHSMNMQIIKISAQLEKFKIKTSQNLGSHRKPNKSVQQPKISEIPIFDPSQNQLNPELRQNTQNTQTIQIKTRQPPIRTNIDLLIRQNYTMKNILKRLQHDISLISIKNLMYERAIEWSNKQIIDLNIKSLENRLKKRAI